MKSVDWIVLAATLLSIVLYGIYKGRGSGSLKGFFLADKKMRWYTVALSIMATQASAITFTSTPGQAYVDGMRFVQVYFGLPFAMIILAVTVVPIYHKLGVYTAYEYLEHRFDLKTRVLTSFIFLIQRGLAVGITIYAPSLVLSVMLGWDIRLTSTIIGGVIITYTTFGGVKAVNWTDFQQMLIIMSGMVIACILAIALLPQTVRLGDAWDIAGSLGKLNTLDFTFDMKERYNIWSGLIGGLFLSLAYFGTDQSQVQRYLTGESVRQSRLGLLFNGLVKVPMQFFILFIGVMVFVLFQFERPPLFFNPVETQKVRESPYAAQYQEVEKKYDEAFEQKSQTLQKYLQAKQKGDPAALQAMENQLRADEEQVKVLKAEGVAVLQRNNPTMDSSDTNFIFLSYVMKYLPAGLVGLLFACIFAASMSSTSGELSALATCSVVDIYKRLVKKDASERHYMAISRASMALWGVYAILFAQYASRLGSLVEAVNILGSLFYGTMLGIFLIAFYFKSIGGTATCIAAFIGEAVVLSCFWLTDISWLWYNVIGCVVVVGGAVIIHYAMRIRQAPA